MSLPDEVLSFWFGELDEHGLADEAHRSRWFQKSDAFDAAIRDRFMDDYQAIARGEREAWLETPRGWLAYLIVLDQFSRNMFRGDPAMYAQDERALAATHAGLARDFDQQLAGHMRVFSYMPLMHSEALADQQNCVERFAAFKAACDGPLEASVAYNLRFAEEHRDIIADWGRFPHRNEILGRKSTSEELAFLEQPGSSF